MSPELRALYHRGFEHAGITCRSTNMAGPHLTLTAVVFAILAAKLPAEPFYALAAIGAVLTITPVVIGFLGQMRGLSIDIDEIRDEMTYALPIALLVAVALIVYLVGTP